VLSYRTKAGRDRRYTIGSVAAWPLEKARDEAKALKVRIDQGEDPAGDRQAARAAPTVRDLALRAVAEHYTKIRPSTRYDICGKIDEETGEPLGGQLTKWILPALGARKVEEIRIADVEALHRKVTKAGSPVRANHCVATLSKMLSLAV